MDKVFELTRLTGCSVGKAVDALNFSKGDLKSAVEYILKDGKTGFNKLNKLDKTNKIGIITQPSG